MYIIQMYVNCRYKILLHHINIDSVFKPIRYETRIRNAFGKEAMVIFLN